MTLILRTDGVTVDVNPAEVEALEPLPPAYLPVGIPAGTWIRFAAAPPIAVQGTVAAVAATLAIPTNTLGGTEFVFRPGAVDNPAAGLFGTWASLTAGVATLVAAGAPFSILVDLSLTGVSFPVPAPTNFGGQCTLRGLPVFFALALQCTQVNTLSGVIAIDGLTIEATGAGPTGALLMPVGVSALTLRNFGRIVSTGLGPVLNVLIGDTLQLELLNGASIDTGATVFLGGVGAALTVIVDKSSTVQNDSIGAVAASTLVLVKNDLTSRLPTSLAAVPGYNGGGVANAAATLAAPCAVAHGSQYGAAALPLIFGVYFLEAGGNSAVALATAVDSPMMEPQNNNRPRLLAGALISADADGTDGANASTVELLVNGVPVPGAKLTSATCMNLQSAPAQLSCTQGAVLLAPGDIVSCRFSLGAAGIVATPTNPRCQLLAG